MCGIAGIVRLQDEPVSPEELDRMTDALQHRGPDGRGTVIHGRVGLGHRRLSILDRTDAGAQPMLSDDGQVALSFNGEIYNFLSLRKELEASGRRFRSHCDTEVLLALYEQEGEQCVHRLRGMFAFAVHDRRRNIVFLARDRVGKKPLLYFCEAGTFAFASDIAALRTLSLCPRGIDHAAIYHYLTLMYVPSPATGFSGIHALPAAHTLTIDLHTGMQRQERYWTLTNVPDEKPSVAEWQERIRHTFEESVRLRMVADVPVGAFLSGGVDSGAVVAAMSRMSDRPVQTFSIGSEDSMLNELPLAAAVAQRYNTDHHPIMLQPDIVRLLPELVSAYQVPFADPSSIPSYLVARETRRSVTVALNGDGGDENFGGYIRYPILRFSQKWRVLPRPLHAVVHAGVRAVHEMAASTLSYRMLRFQSSISAPWEERYLQYLSFFTEEEKRLLWRGAAVERTDAWYAALTREARERANDVVRQAMQMDMQTYLADDLLPKVDRATMAHGLEARSPLLDHTLLELTAQIPTRHLLHGRTGKWIFKDMLRSELPQEILFGKKRGFRLPLDTWFRGPLRGFVEESILSSPSAYWEMFDRAAMEAFLRHYQHSKIDYSDHVWALLWLSQWTLQYI